MKIFFWGLCSFFVIQVYSAETGSRPSRISWHHKEITTLFLAQQNGENIIIAGDIDGRVGLWCKHGTNFLEDDPHQELTYFNRIEKTVRPDRQRRVTDIAQQGDLIFVATSNGIIRLYDLTKELPQFIGIINCSASPFSFQSNKGVKRVRVYSSDSKWDWEPHYMDEKYDREFWQMDVQGANRDETVSLEALSDGRLAVGLGWDYQKHIFDPSNNFSRARLFARKLRRGVRGLTSAEDILFVGYDDGMIRSWNEQDGQYQYQNIAAIAELSGYRPHKKMFLKTFSGTSLLAACWQNGGAIHVFDVEQRAMIFLKSCLVAAATGSSLFFVNKEYYKTKSRHGKRSKKKSHILNQLDVRTGQLDRFRARKSLAVIALLKSEQDAQDFVSASAQDRFDILYALSTEEQFQRHGDSEVLEQFAEKNKERKKKSCCKGSCAIQ